MDIEKFQINTSFETSASLTAYLVNNKFIKDVKKKPAIIICPGGGYEKVSEREGEPVAIKMLDLGFQSFILDYNVYPYKFPVSLVELAKSVQLVRDHSNEWSIDPDKIVVAGFSAGGHLAASLGVFWSKEWLSNYTLCNNELIKPNFLLLAYPVISAVNYSHLDSIKNLIGDEVSENLEKVSLELHVDSKTPKTFLWHTSSDKVVPAENSLMFAKELSAANVTYELHLFSRGRHGISLANKESAKDLEKDCLPEIAIWPNLFSSWFDINS